MIETKNGGGVAIDSTQLLEWIAVHEDQIKRDHARFVQNRDYDLCKIMDGHADAMWQLREWLKWTHNIVPSNSNKVVRGAEPSAGPRTSPPTGSDFCVWKPDNDGNWETTCGQMHVFFDGTPHQNNYRFCPYCGKKLSQTEGEDHE